MVPAAAEIRDWCRVKWSPRFNNAHVRLARIGDSDFSGKLMLRLDRLAEVVPPQVRNIVKNTTGGQTGVECITLVGSAASFPSYSDFDVNVLLRGGSMPYHKAMLRMRDEANRDFDARAGLSFHDVQEIDPYEYAVFVYG